MSTFIKIENEPVVQVNDKTRIDVSNTFSVPEVETITTYEIDPDGTLGFIDVTSNKYIDYAYTTAGTQTISVRITTNLNVYNDTTTIEVLTALDDKLFSSDQDLILHEADILGYVKPGRSSFLDMHRRSQQLIIAWFDEHGVTDVNRNPLTKDDIVDIQEVKEWSIHETLRLIFESLSNAVDDVFSVKGTFYEEKRNVHRNRAFVRLDRNNDGTVDTNEGVNKMTVNLGRR